jgi:hypothetical protein
MPKATSTRVRKSKVEVEKAFAKLADDVSEKLSQADPKLAELARERDTEIRQSVSGVSVEGIAQRLASLGVEVTRALSDLSSKLVTEFDRLTELREAVSLETKELERLHQIDLAATAIDQMVQRCHSQKAELEKEIEGQRAAWKDGELNRQLLLKKHDDNLKKQRQREFEEDECKKALEGKKAQDKYDEDARVLEKKNKE